MNYIVNELQTTNGVTASLVYAFGTRNEAEQKYHQVLSYAAVSSVPVHACIMFDETGTYIKAECFLHDIPVPDPEPEPEPEPDPEPEEESEGE